MQYTPLNIKKGPRCLAGALVFGLILLCSGAVQAQNLVWAKRAGGRPEEIRTLVVHPLDPNVVYAALARHGIYRTADGGASWHKFNQGLPFIMGGPIRTPKLAFHPEESQRLYLVFNQRVHSHLIRTRRYLLSGKDEWLPMEVGLPSNFLILALIVDGTRRTLQVWGPDAVWEVPLAEKHCSTP